MQKKILITGASGFIGSFMAQRALEEGMETWAAVRPTSSRRYLADKRLRFIELELGDEERLASQLNGHCEGNRPFDYVIHAAGATKCRHTEDFFNTNTLGTKNLARALLATGALREQGRFVFLSSLSVLGPVHEKDRKPISSKDRPAPNTAYGRSKLAAERALGNIEGLNYVILRPTGVYGPRERDYFLMAQSIRRHVDFAAGYKPQILTFIYVRDLVSAAFRALTHGFSGRAYLLTDGHSYTSRTFSELLQMEMGVCGVVHFTAPLWLLRLLCVVLGRCARLLGKTSTLNPDKYRIMSQRNWQCDIAPARNELGYIPKWPLAKGVREAVGWYKKEGWL